jgi:hypothetical protein
MTQAMDPLDAYGREAPNPQQTMDIFKGLWESSLPPDIGVTAGGIPLFDDPRLREVFARVDPAGARVLELGPLEGGHSCMLQRAGAASVVSVEACVAAYLKCLVVKELLGLDRVRFLFGDFMAFLAESDETFDLVLASGVLYHQRDPIECIRRLALRSDCVYFWTHFYDDVMPETNIVRQEYFRRTRAPAVDGFSCDLFRLDYDAYVPGIKYRGSLDDHAHWLRKADLLACLDYFGLGAIEILAEQTVHTYAPNVTLLARRRPERIRSKR